MKKTKGNNSKSRLEKRKSNSPNKKKSVKTHFAKHKNNEKEKFNAIEAGYAISRMFKSPVKVLHCLNCNTYYHVIESRDTYNCDRCKKINYEIISELENTGCNQYSFGYSAIDEFNRIINDKNRTIVDVFSSFDSYEEEDEDDE